MHASASLDGREPEDAWMKPNRSCDGARHWCETPEVGSRGREESKTTACQNIVE
jgi:hypothetical protein